MTIAAAAMLLAWSAFVWRAGSLLAPAVRSAVRAGELLSAGAIVTGVAVNLLFLAYLVGIDVGWVWSTGAGAPFVLRLLGLVLALSGFLLARWGRNALDSDWTPLVVFAGSGLCEVGPYGFVRHPIYAGAILFYLGVAVAADQTVGFVLMGMQIVAYLGKTALEERSLRTGGDLDYRHFMEATRWRLLPGVY
jgi:protein-S-isoprenylcysteine O-methyltransferase Ste14